MTANEEKNELVVVDWLLSFLERFFCISNDFYGMCTAVQFLLQISTNRYVEPFIYYINK